jgi:hypothetical protein
VRLRHEGRNEGGFDRGCEDESANELPRGHTHGSLTLLIMIGAKCTYPLNVMRRARRHDQSHASEFVRQIRVDKMRRDRGGKGDLSFYFISQDEIGYIYTQAVLYK